MPRSLALLFVAAFAAFAGPSAAETGALAPTPAQYAALCERAVLDGAARGGVPSNVLHAISLTETGRPLGGRLRPWPWAINREGQGHWFGSRAEALAFAKASLAEGRRSFDVGCFQINYHWHGHNFPSLEAMFDQDVAAAYAAQFLRSLHGELGTWSAAAGAYHSRTPSFAQRYRARFDRLLAGLGGGPLLVAEAALAEDDPSAPPRKSRTRMSAKPKIITLDPAPGRPARNDDAEVAAIRVERGRLPPGLGAAPVRSSRDAPL